MIENTLKKAVDKRLSLGGPHTRFPPGPPAPAAQLSQGIPTLEKGVARDVSPQLRERYVACGRWLHATHGHWLGLDDMRALWDAPADPLVQAIKLQAESLRDNWANHAYALFRPARLSLFAGSDLGNESIFLLWLDFEDEPEVWVYDANGESRYKDLGAYLESYLADDVSAAERSWRA
jgi:hypothetical protein